MSRSPSEAGKGQRRVEFKGTVTRLNLSGKEDTSGVEGKAVLTVEVDPAAVDLYRLSLLAGLASVGITLEHPQAVLPAFEAAGSRV